MTNPVPVQQGNPDWGRQIAYGAIKILQRSAATASGTSVGPIYAGNLPFMYVRLSSIQPTELGIAWFMDAAGTQSLFGDVITIDATAADAMVCIPVRGPYVKFTFLHAGVTPTINLDVFSVPSRFNVYTLDGGKNVLVSGMNVNLAGGANTTVRASTVRAGRAYWSADLVGGVNFTIYLLSFDYLGVSTILDVAKPANRASARYLFIPATPMGIQVFNQDAGAHDYQVSLLFHPFDD